MGVLLVLLPRGPHRLAWIGVEGKDKMMNVDIKTLADFMETEESIHIEYVFESINTLLRPRI